MQPKSKVSNAAALSLLSNGGATLEETHVIRVNYFGAVAYWTSCGHWVRDPRAAKAISSEGANANADVFRAYLGAAFSTAKAMPLSEAVAEFEGEVQ